MSKRKPPGFWDVKENQKAFLDDLAAKTGIEPTRLSYTLIRKHGGAGALFRYPSTLALLETHYGPISLLDRGRVPDGIWDKKSNRIKAVREAVQRLRKRADRVGHTNFRQIGLGGLLTVSGMKYWELLREAGFDVPSPADWAVKKRRVKKVRDLVDKAGGPLRVTSMYIEDHESGLIAFYRDYFPKELPRTLANLDPVQPANAKDPYIPLLYWILEEAGYDVTPADCRRKMGDRSATQSRHGHWNHSCQEAMLDDWIHDFIGMNHLHDILYPGQPELPDSRMVDCDFVLLPEEILTTEYTEGTEGPEGRRESGLLTTKHTKYTKSSERKRGRGKRLRVSGFVDLNPGMGEMAGDMDLTGGLWVEYAGISIRKTATDLSESYLQKLEKKKTLAKAAGLELVIITPQAMANPEKVWEEMVSRALWLKPYSPKALNSPYLELFGSD
ncbi:hypothetical protein ACFL4W_03150 [Planctomycetota bacterium]